MLDRTGGHCNRFRCRCRPYLPVVAQLTAPRAHIQSCLHDGLALRCRRVQDPHVLEVGAAAEPLDQRVVRATERERRKQRLPIAVSGERSRLTHQRPDDMPVVDGDTASTSLSFHRGHEPLVMPDLDRLGVKPQVELFPDQPRADRALSATRMVDPRLSVLPTRCASGASPETDRTGSAGMNRRSACHLA